MSKEQGQGVIHLKSGREKPVRQRHPWVFSGAIARVSGDPQVGDVVEVVSSQGEWLARGYYNAHSQIQGRLLTWDENKAIDDAFWRSLLQRALAGRELLGLEELTNAYRLVNAESGGLPGLVVDRYDGYLVMQCLTAGIDKRRELLVGLLQELLSPAGILERSDVNVRKKEGLRKRVECVAGEVPEHLFPIREHGHTFLVDVYQGHKTGLYLDQRDNRALICQPQFVAGKRILNVFSYTGGFAVYAANHEAGQIVNIDSSAPSLEIAEQTIVSQCPDRVDDQYIVGDAFEVLRHLREEGEQFDMVILDPPKFVHSKRDMHKASRGYKDINLLALQLLVSGGLLATFSCSGLVSADLWQKIVFGAVADSGRDVQLLYHCRQSPDHPVSLTFPESAYLKGFLCRVW